MKANRFLRAVKPCVLVTSAAAAIACATSTSSAAPLWDLAGEGDWTTATNWSTDVAPVPGDDAQISNGGTAVISTPVSAGALSIAHTAGSTGTVKINGGSLTTNTSDIRVGGSSATMINGNGTLEQSAGDIVMNAGNFVIGFGSTSAGATPTTGTYTLSGGSVTMNSGNIFAIGNRGTGVMTQTGGTVYVRGTAVNTAAGVLQLGRNTAAAAGRGTYTLSGGKAVASNFVFGNAITTSNGAPTNTMNLQGTGVLQAGTVNIINTAATNIFNFTGGTLTANTINLPTLTNDGGTLSPATLSFAAQANVADVVTSLVGTTTINGNYVQNAAGTLELDLLSDFSFDFVSVGPSTVAGNATIGGTIAVSTLNGFDPAPGTTFDVVAADLLDNTATVTGLTPSGNAYQASEVIGTDGREVLRLTVVPEPGSLAVLSLAGLTALRRRRR